MDALKNYRQLGSQLMGGLVGTVRLARALPGFFREPITVAQAEEAVRKAVARRGETFLELAGRRIYANPESPYLKLLRIAGCELADLQALVRRDGLETTLEKLAREGVYLTSDEFKGTKEVRRGGRLVRVSPNDFERQEPSAGIFVQTSGTSNQPLRAVASLHRLAYHVPAMGVFFAAHGLYASAHAMYDAILPGSGGTSNLLIYAKLGIGADRWFARKIPAANWLAASYHYFTTHLIVGMGKWHGPGFPRPEWVDVEEGQRIVRWVLEQRARGKACCITTAASNAVRIARAAQDMGASLEGTKFIVSGEPLTEAKQELIGRAGGSATCRYAFTDAGIVGFGCARPSFADEVHVNQDIVTLVPHPEPLDSDSAIRPFLFTTLQPQADRLLLNVENGDYGTLEKRDCGCALEKAGLTLHLHHVRSYEKFTSEGMNYFYGDLFEFIEKILPSEFGGGPGDYQLTEEEDGNGQTRLTLVVRPEVGEVDETKILLRLQERLGQGSSANRFQAKIWQNAGTLRVKRAVPHSSPRGKILPLHISR